MDPSSFRDLVLAYVREHVSPAQFETWFAELDFHWLGDGRLTVTSPNELRREWLDKYYRALLVEAAQSVSERTVDVVLRARSNSSAPAAVKATAPEEQFMERRASRAFPLNPQYTFEDFVVGPSNRLCHAACLAVAHGAKPTYNPLFIHGQVGLGKTHLLQAVCHTLSKSDAPLRLAYLTCETFVNDFITAIRKGELDGFRNRYRDVDVLIVDDIQFLTAKERSQEEFFHTFNKLHNETRQIILSSDAPPAEIPALEQRLISRFKWGLVARLDAPDYETRVAIVQQKATARGVSLPDQVSELIATRVQSNIRELEGALARLIAFATLSKRGIDIRLAQELFPPAAIDPRRSNLDEIIRTVAACFDLPVKDLKSKRRTQGIAIPRQVCMYLCRKLADSSLQEIGRHLGGRDHSTVLYGSEKVDGLLGQDAALCRKISTIEQELSRHA